MRDYGVSPSVKVLEHFCRHARLYFFSIVLTTLVVSSLAAMRASMYTAKALVVLDEKPESDSHAAATEKPGDEKTTLGMLNVFQRDSDFMKAAIRNAILEQTHPELGTRHVWPKTGMPVDYRLDPDMGGSAFDAFCKRAAQSLTVTQRDGVLEIACRWPDRHAADIVNAFYWAFHDEVVRYRTADSQLQESLLAKLLEEYKAAERRLDEQLLRYRKDHVADPVAESSDASSRFSAMVTALADLQANITQLQEKRDAYAMQLKTVPPKIKSMEIRGRSTDTPLYLAAMQKRNEAQQALDTLKAKYQDVHPKVQEAQRALDAAEEQFKKAEKISSATPNITQSTTIPNPEYDRILAAINQADADLKGMRATLVLKQKQTDAEKKRVLAAGANSSEIKRLADQRTALQATKTSLEGQLQAAQLARKKNFLRASAQASVMSRPVAEQDAAGPIAILMYAAGPILGILLAFVFSRFAQRIDHTLRTPADVEKRLGKPVLAVLPRSAKPRGAAGAIPADWSNRLTGEGGQRTLPPG